MKIKKVTWARLRPTVGNGVRDVEDMLRYDVAFQSTKDPTLVAFPRFQTRGVDWGGTITHKRWESFGIAVDVLDQAGPVADVDHLITYRHKPPDYQTLIPYTLGQFISAKTPRHLDDR